VLTLARVAGGNIYSHPGWKLEGSLLGRFPHLPSLTVRISVHRPVLRMEEVHVVESNFQFLLQRIVFRARYACASSSQLRQSAIARMPRMDGVRFLQKAREIFPEAKRALLTAYAYTNAAISAINEAGINYFFLKPRDPHPDYSEPQAQGRRGGRA
jgi:response regulator RpfG family c-di-GMP phosphodiesterase